MKPNKEATESTEIEITGSPGIEVEIVTYLDDRTDRKSYKFTDKRTIKQSVRGGKDKKIIRDF